MCSRHSYFHLPILSGLHACCGYTLIGSRASRGVMCGVVLYNSEAVPLSCDDGMNVEPTLSITVPCKLESDRLPRIYCN